MNKKFPNITIYLFLTYLSFFYFSCSNVDTHLSAKKIEISDFKSHPDYEFKCPATDKQIGLKNDKQFKYFIELLNKVISKNIKFTEVDFKEFVFDYRILISKSYYSSEILSLDKKHIFTLDNLKDALPNFQLEKYGLSK